MIKGFIKIDKERCKGCGFCVEHCPKKILKIGTFFNSKGYLPAEFSPLAGHDNKNNCNGCALCAIVCPDMAIEVYRE
ncbi:MAG: 4Fe-4S binding protein [Pseudomonadota bacterium]